MGPSKFTIARPISAPYSSCRLRIDSGDPSKPDRLASTTRGRLPDAALIARATFLDDRGNSVPDVNVSGPSLGGNPARGMAFDSMPTTHTEWPPTRASITTAVSASAMPAQRSTRSASWSQTAAMTERMSKGFLRSGLWVAEKISPTVAKPSPACGKSDTSRSTGSDVGALRGASSPSAM